MFPSSSRSRSKSPPFSSSVGRWCSSKTSLFFVVVVVVVLLPPVTPLFLFLRSSANAKLAQSKHNVFPVPVGDSNSAFWPLWSANKIFSIITIWHGYGANGMWTLYVVLWTTIGIGGMMIMLLLAVGKELFWRKKNGVKKSVE